jgi:hypothetical protein
MKQKTNQIARGLSNRNGRFASNLLGSWIILLLSLVVVNQASAWFAQTHNEMSDSVYSSLPQDIQTHINKEAFLFGSNEPDHTMYDPNPSNPNGFKNIDWDEAARKTGIARSDLQSWSSGQCFHGNPACINQLSEKLKTELSSPNRNWNKISVLMGQMSHQVQDLYQPYHAAEILGYPKDSLKDHNQFEEWAKQQLAGKIPRNLSIQNPKDLNTVARESVSRLGAAMNRDPDQLRRIANAAAGDSLSRIKTIFDNAARTSEQDKIRNELRGLIDESKQKILELGQSLHNQGQEAIKQHKEQYPGAYNQEQKPAPKKCPHPKRCNFRWTDPETGTRWCCPYNNGWNKECVHGFKGEARRGCYWGFGCCEDD